MKTAFIVDFSISFRVIAGSVEEAIAIATEQLPDGTRDHLTIPSAEEDTQNPYDKDIDEG